MNYTQSLRGKWRKPISHTECYAYAQELRERADAMNKSASHAHDGCVGSMVSGRSGRTRAMDRACDRAMDTMLNRYNEAKKLRERATHWQAKGREQDPAEIQKRITTAEVKRTTAEMIADWYRAYLKPGDTVFHSGQRPAIVKRVNKNGITCTNDIKWVWGEITPSVDGREMTVPEMVAAVKAHATQADQTREAMDGRR